MLWKKIGISIKWKWSTVTFIWYVDVKYDATLSAHLEPSQQLLEGLYVTSYKATFLLLSNILGHCFPVAVQIPPDLHPI